MADACPHHGPTAAQPAVADRAIAAAERKCLEAGERWTEPRRRTYELLAKSAGPLKAYDLIAAYGADAGTKPPTVYRALEFLASLGLVHRIETMNAYIACASDHHRHSAQFLICDCCHDVREVEGTAQMDAIQSAANKRGFTVRSATVELRGLCLACRQAAPHAGSGRHL